jgi:hypothetical protein
MVDHHEGDAFREFKEEIGEGMEHLKSSLAHLSKEYEKFDLLPRDQKIRLAVSLLERGISNTHRAVTDYISRKKQERAKALDEFMQSEKYWDDAIDPRIDVVGWYRTIKTAVLWAIYAAKYNKF